MKKLILSIFCITGCMRPTTDIGSIVTDYHIECLKTKSNIGLGFGDKDTSLIVQDQCVASQCYKRESKLGKHYGSYEILNDAAVNMEECAKWKSEGNSL